MDFAFASSDLSSLTSECDNRVSLSRTPGWHVTRNEADT